MIILFFYYLDRYSQRPMAATKMHDIIGAYRLPAGQNLTVAIACASNNEEDSAVYNQDTIDMGFGCSNVIKTCTVSEKRSKRGNRVERVEKIGIYPKEQCTGWKDTCDYSQLDPLTGIIKKGSKVKNDTILVQKAELRSSVTWKQNHASTTSGGTGNSTSGSSSGTKKKRKTKNEIKNEIKNENKNENNKNSQGDKNNNKNNQDAKNKGENKQDENVAMIIDNNQSTDDNWDDNILYNDTSFVNKSVEPGEVIDVYTRINEQTGCLVVKIKICYTRIPQEADKFCLTPDHQVLTREGWKEYKELTMNDQIATLNPENHQLEYQQPIGLYEFDHKGPMYHVESQQVDLVTTMNHKMYIKLQEEKNNSKEDNNNNNNVEKFQLKEAREIYQKNVVYKYDAIISKSDYLFQIPGFRQFTTEEMQNWIVLFGMYMSTNSSFAITNIGDNKEQFLTAISNLGWKYSSIQMMNNSDFLAMQISHKPCAKYFQEFVQNKTLPSWCFDLNQQQSKLLVQSIVRNWNENFTKIATILQSRELCNDLQRICLNAGLSATISNDNVVTIYNNSQHNENNNQNNNQNTNNNNQHQYNQHQYNQNNNMNKNIETIVDNYNGKVYCVEVPKYHIFYVRRNGKPVWTGNSSRHGQKVTIGKVMPSEDIFYDPIDGTSVDLIYNPCAFISRMTYGQKIEALLGLVCAITGEFGDASPHSTNYRQVLRKVIKSRLKKAGFTHNEALMDISEALSVLGVPCTGSISMICGRSNKRMVGLIHKGTTYIQKLKHMVVDKVRGRSTGKKSIMTKQSVENKGGDAGLKIGEMENANLVAYAGTAVIQDKMFLSADSKYVHICKQCSVISIYNRECNFDFCPNCRQQNTSTNNPIPATFEDFTAEIKATGLNVQFQTEQLN